MSLIPEAFLHPETTLVVYTPAIPANHKELVYFQEHQFEIHKRAQVLGMLTQTEKGMCVAGTHGKTTTSTMAAFLMDHSHVGCNAFLGGISKNYQTNLLLSDKSDYVVIEADEFDRSFHWLTRMLRYYCHRFRPLDIYGTHEAYLEVSVSTPHLSVRTIPDYQGRTGTETRCTAGSYRIHLLYRKRRLPCREYPY